MVSDKEPFYGSGERVRGLIPIGLEGEEREQGRYEETGAWMDRFMDISLFEVGGGGGNVWE